MPDRRPRATDDDARAVTDLADRIAPLIAGHPSPIQGAALADLLACWLAGHSVPGDPAGTDRSRAALLKMHLETVRQLLPLHHQRIHKVRH